MMMKTRYGIYIPSPITHNNNAAARCTHCTWTTTHDSFLRHVTSDLYISGSYWPCARVSSHSLWSLRDATQPRRCDAMFASRQLDTPVHTYAPPRYGVFCHHGLLNARSSSKERNVPRVCNVASRSYDCRPKPSSCSVRTYLALPSSRWISWSSPRVSPALSVSPARISGRGLVPSIAQSGR